jgi:hypothetical protein
MQIRGSCRDPWSHVIMLLASIAAMESALPNKRLVTRSYAGELKRAVPVAKRGEGAIVRIRERSSSTTAKVEWCDSTSCRYGDQVWSVAVARRDGLCAYSGRAIRKGERVYKPRKCRVAPVNANAMIAAHCMDGPFP